GGASVANALLVACALAVLAYTDYYYFVFGLVLAVVYLLLRHRRFEWRPMPLTPARRRTLKGLVAIALGLLAAIVVLALVGGFDLRIVDWYVGARSTFNLRGALWVVVLVALFVWKRPRIRLVANDDARGDSEPERSVRWRSIAAGAVALIVLLLPLIVEAIRLIASNDYASQTYLWRSAPRGIDIGALVLGNPFHPLYGSWVRAEYARLGIDVMEGAVWLGIVPVACVVLAALRLRAQAEVQRWMLVTGLFSVWALGPFLMTFGANTGF